MSSPQLHPPVDTRLKATQRVAIIGAGASGIVCARELNKRGWKNVSVFEASNRAGGRTLTRVIPHPVTKEPEYIELGTTTILVGPVLDEILKETGLNKEFENLPKVRVKNPPQEQDYHPFFMPTPEPISLPRKMIEMGKFIQAINRVDFLDKPGFSGAVGKGVSMPIEDWFRQENLVLPKFIALPVISSGLCGCAYDRVPLAYMVKIYKIMLRNPLWRNALTSFRTLKTGNNEIWHSAAKGLPIRYEQPVKSIRRENGKLNVITKDASLEFDRVIWTGTLPALENTLDKATLGTPGIAKSREHYGKVQYLRRGMFTYRFEGLPRNSSWIHTDNIMRKEHGAPLACGNVKNTDWYYFYPWMRKDQSIAEVDLQIREFATQLGGRLTDMATEPAIWDYCPFFGSEHIEQGVFDDIERDQGQDGIYLCGETLSGITLPAVTEFAKDLIVRHF